MSSACSPLLSSSAEQKSDDAIPSTSQDYQETSNSSPPLARSVPTSHEASSPLEHAAGNGALPNNNNYVYFTSEMANQAVLDIEREKDKFDTLLKWYARKVGDIPELGAASRGNSTASSAEPLQEAKDSSSTPLSSQPSSHGGLLPSASGMNGFPYSPHPQPGLGDGGPGSAGPVIGKDEKVDLDDISPTFYEDMDVKPQLKRKHEEDGGNGAAKVGKPDVEENPLRRLEMMSAAQHFSHSSTINEVVESSSGTSSTTTTTTTIKKDERAIKLEKLDGIEKSLFMEDQQKMVASPGHYPYPPFPPGPFSAGAYPGPPGGVPPGAAPPGPYPYFGMPHHGYPMSAPPGGKPFPSPSFPPGAMPMPGRMPPHPAMMNPHFAQWQQQQQHQQQMAFHQQQMAKASPGGMPKGSPAHSPFPPGHPAHHQAAAAYHHHMMMMRQGMPPNASPYGPPMMPGVPPSHMMNPAAQNSLMMVARGAHPGAGDPSAAPGPFPSSAWAPQLTPCYPPSFPAAVTPSGSSRATPVGVPTPSK